MRFLEEDLPGRTDRRDERDEQEDVPVPGKRDESGRPELRRHDPPLRKTIAQRKEDFSIFIFFGRSSVTSDDFLLLLFSGE